MSIGFQAPIAALQVDSFASALVLLFALLIGHAIADFPLQGKFLAIAKNRHADLDQFFSESEAPRGIWFHALGAHSFIHAAPVWILTGSVGLAALEVILHWCIDFAKCEDWTSFGIDQLLHFLCKLAYVILVAYACPLAVWQP